jgi:hypothetical protein
MEGIMPDLEALLGEHLSSVHAPRELWERVHTPREPRAEHVSRQLAWVAAAAAVLIMGSAIGLHAQMKNPTVKQPVQAWVKSSTGLDIHGACRLCHID